MEMWTPKPFEQPSKTKVAIVAGVTSGNHSARLGCLCRGRWLSFPIRARIELIFSSWDFDSVGSGRIPEYSICGSWITDFGSRKKWYGSGIAIKEVLGTLAPRGHSDFWSLYGRLITTSQRFLPSDLRRLHPLCRKLYLMDQQNYLCYRPAAAIPFLVS